MRKSARTLLGSALCLIALAGIPATAQEVTGTLGSPAATSTVDGNYLPNPPAPFGGVIGLEAADSTPWWAPQVLRDVRQPGHL